MPQKTPFVAIVPWLLRAENLPDLLITDLISANQPVPSSVKRVKDLTEFDHIVIYPSLKIWFTNYKKLTCKVSLMIVESKAVHRKYFNSIWLLRLKFYAIFVRYTALANKYNNVISVVIADCWIPKLSAQDFLIKSKLISIIASDIKKLAGHQLRHQIVKQIPDKNIDVMGRGYMPFKDKQDGLLPYYFSIVIENCQETDYFTEKILDAFACKTVPIYWGCPNIGDYFNLDGIITFQTIDELKIILDKLTPASYAKYNTVIEENLKIARKISNKKERLKQIRVATSAKFNQKTTHQPK